MTNWLRWIFGKTRTAPRELKLMSWLEADTALKANVGWRLAPEEDHNRMKGMVYLERDLPATLGQEAQR